MSTGTLADAAVVHDASCANAGGPSTGSVILDAPLSVHFPKLLLWLACEANLIVLLVKNRQLAAGAVFLPGTDPCSCQAGPLAEGGDPPAVRGAV